ncbi:MULTISPECIES: hypothetical protein [Streptomyces]|uniref:hypothetical protein n=1 Tax=Streptomyces TaxID=1883 RepID=UPI001F2CEC63|nr:MULTISPECIES: hypothetical protein [Streptomyces]
MVAQGPPGEVLAEELLAEVHGVGTRIAVHPGTGAPSSVYLPERPAGFTPAAGPAA